MIKVWTDAAEAGILERIGAAIAETSKELQAFIKAHGEFIEVGNRMLIYVCRRLYAVRGRPSLSDRRFSSSVMVLNSSLCHLGKMRSVDRVGMEKNNPLLDLPRHSASDLKPATNHSFRIICT